jgi:hypothetical protein
MTTYIFPPFAEDEAIIKKVNPTYGFNPSKDMELIEKHRIVSNMCDAKTLQSMLKIGATELYAQKYKITSKAAFNIFIKYEVYNAIDIECYNPKIYGIMDAFKFADSFIANKKKEGL